MGRVQKFFQRNHHENDVFNLMEAYIDIVALLTQEQEIIEVNSAFITMLGYSSEELYGNALQSLAYDEASRVKIDTQFQREEDTNPIKVQLAHQNGDALTLELIIRPSIYRQKPIYVAILREPYPQKQRDSDIHYETLLELDDAVFIMDFDGRYIAVNQQAGDMLGLSVEELTGKHLYQFIPEVYHNASKRIIGRLFAGEAVPVYERTFIQANGHRFSAEVSIHLLRDANNEPEYIYSLVRDLTERKQAEDERLELAIERARMGTLQSFLKDASHYFRTPLTSLKTSQYLLTQITDNPAKQEHFLNVMKLEIARLEHLISDMMLSTQLEQDTGDGLTFGRIDIGKVLPEIINTFSPMEKRESHADIIIEPELPLKTLFVMASRSKLSVAIHRLLENAITYSPADSCVVVHAYQDDEIVYINVADEGIGITEEEMPLLFRRFHRADRAVEMAHIGNGLGLFIAQKIVEMHYGEITVESTPDEGSTFTIRLPLAIGPERIRSMLESST